MKNFLAIISTIIVSALVLNGLAFLMFFIMEQPGNYEWDARVGHRLKSNAVINYSDYAGELYSYRTLDFGYDVVKAAEGGCGQDLVFFGDSFLQRNLRPGSNFVEKVSALSGCNIVSRAVSGWSTENQLLDYSQRPLTHSKIFLFLYIGNDFFETNEGIHRYRVDANGHLKNGDISITKSTEASRVKVFFQDTSLYRVLRLFYILIKEKTTELPIVKIDLDILNDDGVVNYSHLDKTLNMILRFHELVINNNSSFKLFIVPSIIDVDTGVGERLTAMANSKADPQKRYMAIRAFSDYLRSRGVPVDPLFPVGWTNQGRAGLYDPLGGHWTELGAKEAAYHFVDLAFERGSQTNDLGGGR